MTSERQILSRDDMKRDLALRQLGSMPSKHLLWAISPSACPPQHLSLNAKLSLAAYCTVPSGRHLHRNTFSSIYIPRQRRVSPLPWSSCPPGPCAFSHLVLFYGSDGMYCTGVRTRSKVSSVKSIWRSPATTTNLPPGRATEGQANRQTSTCIVSLLICAVVKVARWAHIRNTPTFSPAGAICDTLSMWASRSARKRPSRRAWGRKMLWRDRAECSSSSSSSSSSSTTTTTTTRYQFTGARPQVHQDAASMVAFASRKHLHMM